MRLSIDIVVNGRIEIIESIEAKSKSALSRKANKIIESYGFYLDEDIDERGNPFEIEKKKFNWVVRDYRSIEKKRAMLDWIEAL